MDRFLYFKTFILVSKFTIIIYVKKNSLSIHPKTFDDLQAICTQVDHAATVARFQNRAAVMAIMLGTASSTATNPVQP